MVPEVVVVVVAVAGVLRRRGGGGGTFLLWELLLLVVANHGRFLLLDRAALPVLLTSGFWTPAPREVGVLKGPLCDETLDSGNGDVFAGVVGGR